MTSTWARTGFASPTDVLALVDPTGPYLPSRWWATALDGSGSMAADAPSLARWG